MHDRSERHISDLTASGLLRAPITRTSAFDEIDQAFAALQDGAVGKPAIRMRAASPAR